MSSKKPGTLQLTSIGADGVPNGDTEFTNLDEAIRDFDQTTGKWRQDIPDIGPFLDKGDVNFVYEPRLRPVDIGTVPKDGFLGRREGGKWGRAAYDRPLSEKELNQYELTPVGFEDDGTGKKLYGALNTQRETPGQVMARENAKPEPIPAVPFHYQTPTSGILQKLQCNPCCLTSVTK